MTDTPKPEAPQVPTLEDWQHWTYVMGRAQQMMMEYWASQSAKDMPAFDWSAAVPQGQQQPDMGALMNAGAQAWAKGFEAWGKMLSGVTAVPPPGEAKPIKDRRFSAPEWAENPIFDTIRQTYLQLSDQLLGIGRGSRGARRRSAAEAAVRDEELRRRHGAIEFRADQPDGAQAHHRDQGRESAQGPRQHAQGRGGRAIVADPQGGVRGWPQPRDDAGQGHPRDPALPIDPVHADDRHGA